MESLEELLLQQADILEKISAAKESGKPEVLSKVLKLIQDYELTFEDLKVALQEPKIRKKIISGSENLQTIGSKKRGRPRKFQSIDEMK